MFLLHYIMSFTVHLQDPIQKPMLRTELKSVKKEALETFKNILFYHQ